MRNVKFNATLAGLVVLVVLLGIFLHVTGKGSRKLSGAPEPVTSEVRPTSASTVSHASKTPASVVQGQELTAVDFDWRQSLNGETIPKLPREEVEKYVEHNNRNAVSLLAAYRALRDTNYLAEAALNFPNDARVQLGVLSSTLYPEDRRKWLDLFKASAPDNSLANYLSALDHFKVGQSAEAVNELLEAARKPGFQDYAMESKLDEEELNMAAGRTSLQARLSSAGWAEDLLPSLASYKALAQNLVRLQNEYVSAGDNASAEGMAQMGLRLAHRLNSGEGTQFVINELVGNAIENMMLKQLDADTSYEFLDGKTPKTRLSEMQAQKASLTDSRQNLRDMLPQMTEAELLSYTERQRLYGEAGALRWLQQRAPARVGQ
jgi:hypothetical protein